MASQKSVWKGLDRAFTAAGADPQPLDLQAARYVIFSDHHKGKRDGADDFVKCEAGYHAALGYYLAGGYTLIVLGDVEELWECRAKHVIPAYRHTLELEAEFHQQRRYVRFFGNHDDQWEKQASFDKHLGHMFPGLKIREGLRFPVERGNRTVELFLVHGHQGTSGSDKLRWIAKPVVRYIWRPIQRLTGARLNTPATSFTLRGEHNQAMYAWARAKRGVALIAGHTHKPVFLAESETARLEAELMRFEAARPRDAEAIAQARADLEWMRAIERTDVVEQDGEVKPCYFNTGCCSFDDGDCTGLEIADGEIRLVRWPDDDGRPRKKVLRSATLAATLDRL